MIVLWVIAFVVFSILLGDMVKRKKEVKDARDLYFKMKQDREFMKKIGGQYYVFSSVWHMYIFVVSEYYRSTIIV